MTNKPTALNKDNVWEAFQDAQEALRDRSPHGTGTCHLCDKPAIVMYGIGWLCEDCAVRTLKARKLENID